MFLALLPMKSLFQTARRHRTSRILTTNEVNTVIRLPISATVVLKNHDKAHSISSDHPKRHLEKSRSDRAAEIFDLYH